MDNHPIPQDVTNFQFHLIGDMTIKQFGYILGGVILGWALLASPVFFLLKLLLSGICVMGSVLLAFIPIEGRPSDVMLMHFIKAIFSPTQFTYQKLALVGKTSIPAKTTIDGGKPMLEITPGPTQQAEENSSKKDEKVQTESSEVKDKKDYPTVKADSLPVEKEKLQQEIQTLSQELMVAKKEEINTNAQPNSSHEKVKTLEQELQEVLKQKQDLEKQLIVLQKTLSAKKQNVFIPGTAQPQTSSHVKQVPQQMRTSVGIPLVPDVPNLITGVIKDPRGNVLNNILIEVKDKDNNPVRAFKTNQLGQFAAATPLVNGMYTISFEDPAGKNNFDAVEISANGTAILPLEIVSVDARERLRQELFGASV